MSSSHVSTYYDLKNTAEIVRQGLHRQHVGGMWDEIGFLQFDFVRNRGLTPDLRLIDIGCGCLRGGLHFVRYLDAGHYYGIDISQDLLDVGYEQELTAVDRHKLPREQLACNGDFDAGVFGVQFEVALAQSLFTHLPLNHMRLCMARAAGYVKPDGVLYATVFLSPEAHDWSRPLPHKRGGFVSFPASDPYHHDAADLLHAIAGLPWRIEEIRDWNHPRNQTMVIYRRVAT